MKILAIMTIICSTLSLLCLLVLHFISPEFSPRWRMISEYALGKHKWLLTLFFILWGCGSISLAILLYTITTSKWVTLGIIFLLLSAIGQIMGGLFDMKHSGHGIAFAIGVPTLPIAALLISYTIEPIMSILFIAHATWISLVLMATAMIIMISGFKKAGIVMDKNSEPIDKVPDGVIALGGYANRILVFCYIFWLILIANHYL